MSTDIAAEPCISPCDKFHPDPLAGGNAKWRRTFDHDPVEKFNASQPLVQVAPMLHVTDRHFRAFMRQLTCKAQLWTEMVVDTTVLHTSDLDHHLGYSEFEHPIVCQLGGSNPETMAEAAKIVERFKYDEININVGCPSSRVVDNGMFGAVLLRDPSLVANISAKMQQAVATPITIKMRTGIDDTESPEWLKSTVKTLGSGGVTHYIMHARSAWLTKKFSPAQNRSIPPLDYDKVYALAGAFPALHFSINGGVQSLEEVEALLRRRHAARHEESCLYGVMIGRAASDNPAVLADVDRRIYGQNNPKTAESRRTVLEGYQDYLSTCFQDEDENSEKLNLKHAFPYLRPVVGLFHSTRGSKFFRQTLDAAIRKHAKKLSPGEILTRVIANMDESYATLLDDPLEPFRI